MRSLRTRLALTIFLIGGVALLAMSLAVQRFVADDLQARLDTQLRDVGARFAEGRYRDVIDPSRNFSRVLLPGVDVPVPSGSAAVGVAVGVAVNRDRQGLLGSLGEVYTELRDESDQLVLTPRFYRLDETDQLTMRLPTQLPAPTPEGATFSTLSGAGVKYRAVYRSIDTVDGRKLRLLTAVRSEAMFETLGRLRLILGLASLGVLAAIGTAAWFVARLGLRPLRRIETAAATIAAGDLSHRIDDVDPRSEIGRLGRSLNQMMSQVETAFDERAQSEAQLQRFVADASHELRTPLTAIRGHAQLHQRAPGIGADTTATLVQIEAASGRMTAIVENLLSLARGGNGTVAALEAVAAREVIDSVLADARAMHPGRVLSVVGSAGAGEDVVLADRDRLHQSIANLVENALRYTSGDVAIETSPDALAGSAALRIDVRDRGPGIAAEHLSHVFEPFYRVDPGRSRSTGGSGLGLAIVRANVVAVGGLVEARSDCASGSTFSIVLPLSTQVSGSEASCRTASDG